MIFFFQTNSIQVILKKGQGILGDTNIGEAEERGRESVGLVSWFHAERVFVVNI